MFDAFLRIGCMSECEHYVLYVKDYEMKGPFIDEEESSACFRGERQLPTGLALLWVCSYNLYITCDMRG
jgi:hypothetical protein